MRTTTTLLICLLLPGVHAQTGPGGVGDGATNVLWLDASKAVTLNGAFVSAWGDQSGNGNAAQQPASDRQPEYLPDLVNGYPMLQFDNDASAPDHLIIPAASNLAGMDAMTAFCVYRLAEGTPIGVARGILEQQDPNADGSAYAWYITSEGDDPAQHQHFSIGAEASDLMAGAAIGAGTHVNGFVFDGAPPSDATDRILYDGNTVVGMGSAACTSTPASAGDLLVGIVTGRGDARFNGAIGEVILYNEALGTTQRIIVNNYLAAKYGLELEGSDLYTQDAVENGNYDHDVAGIGRMTSADLWTDSRGTGIVEVNNATDLGDDEFLFWGHDNGELDPWWSHSEDIPDGIDGVLARRWRVSEVNTAGTATDVGAIDLTFHLGGLYPLVAADLRLLVDLNGNGVLADDAPISGAVELGNGVVSFPGITALTDGARFTVATTHANVVLPVDLIAFNATPVDHAVLLNWATASEHNNDHFTVERSADGQAWLDIVQVPGAGTSDALHTYSAKDGAPINGAAFYRLRQMDGNGVQSWSSVVEVHPVQDQEDLVFPNPNHGVFTVISRDVRHPVQVVSSEGHMVPVVVNYYDDRAEVDATYLPEGVYFVRTGLEPHANYNRVVVSAAMARW